MFQPRFAIHEHPVGALQHDVLKQIAQEGALRAGAAAAPLADAAHHQKPNSMILVREPVRNVVHARIEPEESLERAEPLLDQILHADQRRRSGRKTEGQVQVGIRIGVDHQNGMSSRRCLPGQ